MGANGSQQEKNNGPPGHFCFNGNLCNNDTNVDNKPSFGEGHQSVGKHEHRRATGSQQVVSLQHIDANDQQNDMQMREQNGDNQGSSDQPQYQFQGQQQYLGSNNVPNFVNNPQMLGMMNRGQNFGYGSDMQQSFANNMFQNRSGHMQMDSLNGSLQQQMFGTMAQQQPQHYQFPLDPFMIQDYKKKCEELVQSSPVLQLTVVSSPTLQRGLQLTINALGLYGTVQSEREKDCRGSGLDGFTYFGSLAYVYERQNDGQPPMLDDNIGKKKIVVNDFVIPFRNQQQSEQHYGRHFQIWIDVSHKSYFIRDCQVGFGVFQKMDPGYAILKTNMLVNVGDVHIFVQLLPAGAEDEGLSYDTLKLKYFGGSGMNDEFEFHLNQMRGGDREITIGRAPECDIYINDKLLSKIQCHIKVVHDPHNSNNYQWIIYDGKKGGQPSTNSTWLYISKDTRLFDGFTFKVNQTAFCCKLQNP